MENTLNTYLKEFNNDAPKWYNQTIIDTFTDEEKATLSFLNIEIGVLEGDKEEDVKKQVECIKGKSVKNIIKYFQDNDYTYMGSYKFIETKLKELQIEEFENNAPEQTPDYIDFINKEGKYTPIECSLELDYEFQYQSE